jgi:hypothetical protein
MWDSEDNWGDFRNVFEFPFRVKTSARMVEVVLFCDFPKDFSKFLESFALGRIVY